MVESVCTRSGDESQEWMPIFDMTEGEGRDLIELGIILHLRVDSFTGDRYINRADNYELDQIADMERAQPYMRLIYKLRTMTEENETLLW